MSVKPIAEGIINRKSLRFLQKSQKVQQLSPIYFS